MAFLVVDVTSQNTFIATPVQRNSALKKAFQWIGEQWHRRYKAKKFTNAATREYGLTPRMGEAGSGRKFAGSYTARKLAKGFNGQGVQAIGETKPFVWSGRSRQNAKASHKVIARGKRGFGSADCIINAPTLNLRPKNARINLREEFERVTEAEARQLEKEGILIYENEITAGRGTKTRFRS